MLSTLPKPTAALVKPAGCTAVSAFARDAIEVALREIVRLADKLPPPVRPEVPVTVIALLALRFSAVCVAVEIGLLASLVLSTLPKVPTTAFVKYV